MKWISDSMRKKESLSLEDQPPASSHIVAYPESHSTKTLIGEQ